MNRITDTATARSGPRRGSSNSYARSGGRASGAMAGASVGMSNTNGYGFHCGIIPGQERVAAEVAGKESQPKAADYQEQHDVPNRNVQSLLMQNGCDEPEDLQDVCCEDQSGDHAEPSRIFFAATKQQQP